VTGELEPTAAALAPAERARLAELEHVVDAGLQTFVDVGRALLEIRDGRLYRATHPTFERYLDERFGISRSRGYRLIDAARVAELVSPTGDIPANEAQARELVPLLDDEAELVETWREIRAQHPETVTAIDVRRVILNRLERVERERARATRLELTADAHVHDDADVRLGDFRAALADLAGDVDAIVTDPPYTRDWLERDAAAFAAAAARMLRPGGTLAVMFGVAGQYELHGRLGTELRYRWTCAYLTPGWHGRMFGPRVATGWKPVLLFQRRDAPTPAFLVEDVVVSEGRDKAHHEWGQSVSGIGQLVERLTRPGELVVDPFVGGGTTAVACRRLGRRFVGCDLDRVAVETTRRRLAGELELDDPARLPGQLTVDEAIAAANGGA
jgi:hypothetical protein